MRKPFSLVFPTAAPTAAVRPDQPCAAGPAERAAGCSAGHRETAVFGWPLLVAADLRAAVPAGSDLPCLHDPELFFAESPQDVEQAKKMCRGCQARTACLAGALERREVCGVWGGELLMLGAIVPVKRPRGRPRKTELAAVLPPACT
jgi:WhiB family redox-sensing transcriptional regulator